MVIRTLFISVWFLTGFVEMAGHGADSVESSSAVGLCSFRLYNVKTKSFGYGTGVLVNNRIYTAGHVLRDVEVLTITVSGFGALPDEQIAKGVAQITPVPLGQEDNIGYFQIPKSYQTDFKIPSEEEGKQFIENIRNGEIRGLHAKFPMLVHAVGSSAWFAFRKAKAGSVPVKVPIETLSIFDPENGVEPSQGSGFKLWHSGQEPLVPGDSGTPLVQRKGDFYLVQGIHIGRTGDDFTFEPIEPYLRTLNSTREIKPPESFVKKQGAQGPCYGPLTKLRRMDPEH